MKRFYTMLAWALLPAAGAGLAACNGNPAAGLCSDYCGCEECSDSEEQNCEDAADEAFEEAKRKGCEEQFESYADCLSDGFECDDDRASYTETCSSESNALADCAGSVIAIGGNMCSIAARICGATEGDIGECSGVVVCASECIVEADSCDITNSPDLTDCITACTGG